MAMTPYGQGKDQAMNIFEPFSWDPFGNLGALWNNEPGKSFASDVCAVASTRVDWKETADSHVFKADLPGKFMTVSMTVSRT